MYVFFGCRLVQNHVYTFGGCDGDCTSGQDWIFYSNDLSIGILNESNSSKSCNTQIQTFTQITTDNMETSDEQYQVVYNSKSSYNECIFVFGGKNVNSDVLCFNLTSFTFTHNFGSPIFSSTNSRLSRSSSLLIVNETSGSEFIYYTTSSSPSYLYKFDIINDATTGLASDFSYPPCMIQNPFNENELLFVEGNGDIFSIYSISDDTMTDGQSLYKTVTRALCVVINNEYQSSEPYLYVFGGKRDKIQRLKLNNNDGIVNTEWELMTKALSINDSNCDADFGDDYAFSLNGFLHHELIYIFYDCVISFNILNHNIDFVGYFFDVKRAFGGV